MNKSQKILIVIALAVTAGLYFFGETVGPKKGNGAAKPAAAAEAQLDLDKLRQGAFANLSPGRQQYITSLEGSVKRGDVLEQQKKAYDQLAAFWKDSVPNPVLHFYYAAARSELDNTEKSLTFAAHSILGYLPYAHNTQEQVWLANRGKQLFEKALTLNNANDSSIVGLGGCIIYGATSDEGPMAGILKVRGVAEKDSTNLFAQYMLGVGGMASGQYDKAASRFEKVADAQPGNVEVLFKLAEAYELAGNYTSAIARYQQIVKTVDVPEMKSEILKRIEQLKTAEAGKKK
ncbi:MAG: tetratricopeptide repeat protein [Chitinophagaceae bacterium]|jgi:tetratricopeptide (TPR) repeat protein|nr:tetratricopeptide repeat protein [Chitinophagaceae bacterium]